MVGHPRDSVGGVAGDEMEIYDLRVTVERIEGRSVCGLEVGDYFELTESSRVRIPPGRFFCLYALQSVIPLLPAKQRRLPASDWLEQDSLVCCPDPDERVIMRIERIGERTMRTERPDLGVDGVRPRDPVGQDARPSTQRSRNRRRRAASTSFRSTTTCSISPRLRRCSWPPRRPSACGSARLLSTRTRCTRSRSPARSPRSTPSRTGAHTWASSRARGSTRSAWRRAGR